MRRRIAWTVVFVVLAVVVASVRVPAHSAKADASLRKIGPAPDFTLTTHTGARLSLRDLRGKVVAVTFIYTTCSDTCPLLTEKLATTTPSRR